MLVMGPVKQIRESEYTYTDGSLPYGPSSIDRRGLRRTVQFPSDSITVAGNTGCVMVSWWQGGVQMLLCGVP